MRRGDLERIKTQLQRRRRLILAASLRAAADIDQLRSAERDPELEEGSQSEQEQYMLSQLGEVERARIAQIDAALQRLEFGKYGVCRDCGEEIAPSRLDALPFALECAECAGRREESVAVDRELARRRQAATPDET